MKKIVFSLLLTAITPALARTPCDGIWQRPLTSGAALLKNAHIKGLPPRPKVYDVMRDGQWDIVWAAFADAEPGGYFIRNGRYVEVWGGVAAGDTAADLAKWAASQGKDVPKPLAACFGWYVAGGRETSPPAWRNPFSR